MLELYLELKQERKDTLQKALDERDARAYVIAVHDLKSNSRLIGATNFGEIAQEMENAGKREDFDYIGENHGRLMEIFDQVVKNVEAEIKGL